MSQSITITQVLDKAFAKHPRNLRKLRRALDDKTNTRSVKELAAEYIEPIITDVSAAFGQEMDPGYVGYMVQYSLINPNHEFTSTPTGVGAFDMSVDDLKKASNFKEFIVLNLSTIMPGLVVAAKAAGLTFENGIVAEDTNGLRIACPDLCCDENKEPIKERMDDWIARVLDTLADMHVATGGQIETNEKSAEPGPCQTFAEDPAICDDVGEPKGQCVCGYKENEHKPN